MVGRRKNFKMWESSTGAPSVPLLDSSLSNFKAKTRYLFAEVHHNSFICINENILGTSLSD